MFDWGGLDGFMRWEDWGQLGVWRVYEGVRFGVSGDVEVRVLARIFR
jgi:hypothetical protein